MRNKRRSIQVAEDRSIQVKERKPEVPKAPPMPIAQAGATGYGKGIVDHLNEHLPGIKPKNQEQTLRELVEKAQKEAMNGYKIGKSTGKSWVDTMFGGMSQEAYETMVTKYNNLLKQQVTGTMLKTYSAQEYPQSTTVSAPPGYKPHESSVPEGHFIPGCGWTPNVDTFETNKDIKIFIDPTLPKDMMVTLGVDGKPVLVQMQPQDVAALLKQGSE